MDFNPALLDSETLRSMITLAEINLSGLKPAEKLVMQCKLHMMYRELDKRIDAKTL